MRKRSEEFRRKFRALASCRELNAYARVSSRLQTRRKIDRRELRDVRRKKSSANAPSEIRFGEAICVALRVFVAAS